MVEGAESDYVLLGSFKSEETTTLVKDWVSKSDARQAREGLHWREVSLPTAWEITAVVFFPAATPSAGTSNKFSIMG